MYRVEDKYLLSSCESELLKRRLNHVMKLDSYCGKSGKYLITSIYFDDCTCSILEDSEEGFSERKKYRLRFYNNDLSYIKLEKKIKKYNRIMKESMKITEEQMKELLAGNTIFGTHSQLLDEYNAEINVSLLKPVILISYERTAFINESGNVRITFDDNIMYSKEIKNASDLLKIGAKNSWKLLSKDTILEVKYDQLLPVYIAQMLEFNNLIQVSFSKYKNSMIDEYF